MLFKVAPARSKMRISDGEITTLLVLTVVSSVHCSSCTFHYGHRSHNLPSVEAGSLPLCSDGLGTSCTFHFDFNYENVLGERKNDAQVYVFESASHRHDFPPVGSGSLPSYSEGPGQLFILYF